MKDYEINLRIAQFCGWKVYRFRVIPPNFPNSVQPLNTIPNYCSDLNAMHEAEMTLRVEGDKDQVYAGSRDWFQACLSLLCDEPIHATAMERARAFLNTIEYLEN